MSDKLTEKGKRKIKSRMTGGDSTGILFPNVYSGEKKKTKPKKKVGGRANFRGGGRTNLLEELGRVEGEHSNKNRRAEVSRIHGELNKGYKKGGRSGYGSGGAVLKGKKVGIQIK